MLSVLLNIDSELLLLINGTHSSIFDYIMIFISSKLGWLPLYMLLLYLIIKTNKKKWWIALIAVAVTITLSDQLSVHLFKNVFERLRPCHNEALTQNLRMIVDCGGSYGFVSSHATNSAALSTLVVMMLKNRYKWILPLMFLYTVLIMYSRVYLGVHYPSDVFAGALLGIAIGSAVFYLYSLTTRKR